MKKVLVAAILGLAATTYVKAQGQIVLYNYNQPSTAIKYGANAVGTVGTGIVDGVGGTWTIGLYFGTGDQTAAINAAMTGDGGNGLVPTLSFASGTSSLLAGYPGLFSKTVETLPGFPSSATGTMVVVAYNGASYASSTIRGHSTAFTAPVNVSPSQPIILGTLLTSFSVSAVPEPSTFALAGLGLAGLLIFRRRK